MNYVRTKSSKRRGAGRPPNGDVAATERLELRVTPDQLDAYQRAADKAGLKRATWATIALDKAAGVEPKPRPEVEKIRANLERVDTLLEKL